MSRFDLSNSTALCSQRLKEMISVGAHGWAVGNVTVRVRYSRGADFSGACYYADQRIFINLGGHVRYPYRMNSHIARTQTVGRRWIRPLYVIELKSAYELTAFIFMHELYHLLVKRSGRNTRQKEGRCDRFAARFLVDTFGTRVLSEKGVPLARADWDFQDVEGFVRAARDERVRRPRERMSVLDHAALHPLSLSPSRVPTDDSKGQMLLFAV